VGCEANTLIDDNCIIIIIIIIIIGRVATDKSHFWYLKLQALCVTWNV